LETDPFGVAWVQSYVQVQRRRSQQWPAERLKSSAGTLVLARLLDGAAPVGASSRPVSRAAVALGRGAGRPPVRALIGADFRLLTSVVHDPVEFATLLESLDPDVKVLVRGVPLNLDRFRRRSSVRLLGRLIHVVMVLRLSQVGLLQSPSHLFGHCSNHLVVGLVVELSGPAVSAVESAAVELVVEAMTIQGEHTLQQLSVSLKKRGCPVSDRASLIEALASHLGKALESRATQIQPAQTSAFSAAEFRQFWSGKSELRHAGGEVRETLVWRGSHVTQRVIDWVLRKQLSCRPGQYRQLHCQLRPLLQPAKRHHSVWSSAISDLNASLAELSSRLTAIGSSAMPLSVNGLLAVAPAFRGACLLPPGWGGRAKQNQLVHECHLQLEASGKWPTLLGPFRAMKTLFCLRLAQTMRSRLPRTEASEIIACRSGVLVTWRRRHRFYLRLALPKEAALARQAGLSSGQSTAQQQQQLLIQADCAESRQLERELVLLPALAGALRGLTSQRPTHGETVRLCLRWLAGHMLLNTAVDALAVELLCAWVAIDASPCSALRGFLLFLQLLARHDFAQQPLIVNLNESLSGADRASIEADFRKRRRHLPAMFIACPQDRTESMLTTARPDTQLLGRLQRCARAALAAFETRLASPRSELLSAASMAGVFRSAPDSFDALLHLAPQPPLSECALDRLADAELQQDCDESDIAEVGSVFNSPGFHWVERLLLTGRRLTFWPTCYGGRCIGVLLRQHCGGGVDLSQQAVAWLDTAGPGLVARVELFPKNAGSDKDVVSVSGANDADLVCSACRIVARQLHQNVENEANEGRTVDSGSFRVDSKGNQRVTKVPYARSDTHLTNALETICEQVQSSWGHSPHSSQPSIRSFVPLTRTDGQAADTSRLTSGSSVDNWLRMRCESLLDDHEEATKSLLQLSQPKPLTMDQFERQLCLETARVCTEPLIALPIEEPPTLPSAATDDKEAKTEEATAESASEEAAAHDDSAKTEL
uniref:Nucleolar protein 6 n=1 Tax=Macrostomum lignano TaxID=282301 RepID=A0A1I8JB41_9PLAT